MDLERIQGVLGLGQRQARPSVQEDDAERDPLEIRLEAFHGKVWPLTRDAYSIFHAQVWRKILFYAGVLWIEWDANRKSYVEREPADEFTPRPEINYFAPAVDSMASIFANFPEIEAHVPEGNDDPQLEIVAQIANQLSTEVVKQTALKSDYKSDEDKVGLTGQWLVLAGSAFTEVVCKKRKVGEKNKLGPQDALNVLCLECDAHAVVPAGQADVCQSCGKANLKVERTTQMVPQMDEMGQPIMEEIVEYDVKVYSIDAISVLPRVGSRSLDGCGYLYIAERLSCDEIWSRYDLEVAPDAEFLDGYSTNFENALNYFYTGFQSGNAATQDSALLIRLYIEPGKVKEFPDGCVAFFAAGKLLRVDPWPDGDYPITKGDYFMMPRVFFGRTPTTDLASLQQEANEYWSIIKLHGLTTAVDPWVVDKSTQVSEITGRADKVIYWRALGPGAKEPHRAGHGSLDAGIYEALQHVVSQFQNISGAVNVWRGEQEGSVDAASAIAQLRSQAELMFARPQQNFNHMAKETVRKAVKKMQQMSVPQLIKIVGEGKMEDVMLFKGADLDRLQWLATSQGMPRTRAEKKMEMIELFDRGLLDPQDPIVKQRAFELFGETGFLQQFNLDASRARRENQAMKQGMTVMVTPDIEDLATHLVIHLNEAKKPDFDTWPEPARQALLAHILQTKLALQATMAPAPEENPNDPNAQPATKAPAKPGAPASSAKPPAAAGGAAAGKPRP